MANKEKPIINAAGVFADPILAVQEMRRIDYAKQSDPLFFGWQRGENTEQEWLDAVQTVKDANPYPAESNNT